MSDMSDLDVFMASEALDPSPLWRIDWIGKDGEPCRYWTYTEPRARHLAQQWGGTFVYEGDE